MLRDTIGAFTVGNIKVSEIWENTNEVLHLRPRLLAREWATLQMRNQFTRTSIQVSTDNILLGLINEVDSLRDGVVNKSIPD